MLVFFSKQRHFDDSTNVLRSNYQIKIVAMLYDQTGNNREWKIMLILCKN